LGKNFEKKVRIFGGRGLTKPENKFYRMKPEEREELAKEFSGLDRILYDRLLEKVGTRQLSAGERVGEGFYLGLTSACPIIGGPFVSNLLMAECDNLQIALERTFTVNEVKEIINELGVSQINNHTEQLKRIKTAVEEGKNEYEKQIWKLEQEIEKSKKIQAEVEEERKKEQEQKQELLKDQNQIHSPDRVNLEELKEKHRKLEEKAKTNEEIIAA